MFLYLNEKAHLNRERSAMGQGSGLGFSGAGGGTGSLEEFDEAYNTQGVDNATATLHNLTQDIATEALIDKALNNPTDAKILAEVAQARGDIISGDLTNPTTQFQYISQLQAERHIVEQRIQDTYNTLNTNLDIQTANVDAALESHQRLLYHSIHTSTPNAELERQEKEAKKKKDELETKRNNAISELLKDELNLPPEIKDRLRNGQLTEAEFIAHTKDLDNSYEQLKIFRELEQTRQEYAYNQTKLNMLNQQDEARDIFRVSDREISLKHKREYYQVIKEEARLALLIKKENESLGGYPGLSLSDFYKYHLLKGESKEQIEKRIENNEFKAFNKLTPEDITRENERIAQHEQTIFKEHKSLNDYKKMYNRLIAGKDDTSSNLTDRQKKLRALEKKKIQLEYLQKMTEHQLGREAFMTPHDIRRLALLNRQNLMMQLEKTHPIFESEMMHILAQEGNENAIKARQEYEKHQREMSIMRDIIDSAHKETQSHELSDLEEAKLRDIQSKTGAVTIEKGTIKEIESRTESAYTFISAESRQRLAQVLRDPNNKLGKLFSDPEIQKHLQDLENNLKGKTKAEDIERETESTAKEIIKHIADKEAAAKIKYQTTVKDEFNSKERIDAGGKSEEQLRAMMGQKTTVPGSGGGLPAPLTDLIKANRDRTEALLTYKLGHPLDAKLDETKKTRLDILVEEHKKDIYALSKLHRDMRYMSGEQLQEAREESNRIITRMNTHKKDAGSEENRDVLRLLEEKIDYDNQLMYRESAGSSSPNAAQMIENINKRFDALRNSTHGNVKTISREGIEVDETPRLISDYNKRVLNYGRDEEIEKAEKKVQAEREKQIQEYEPQITELKNKIEAEQNTATKEGLKQRLIAKENEYKEALKEVQDQQDMLDRQKILRANTFINRLLLKTEGELHTELEEEKKAARKREEETEWYLPVKQVRAPKRVKELAAQRAIVISKIEQIQNIRKELNEKMRQLQQKPQDATTKAEYDKLEKRHFLITMQIDQENLHLVQLNRDIKKLDPNAVMKMPELVREYRHELFEQHRKKIVPYSEELMKETAERKYQEKMMKVHGLVEQLEGTQIPFIAQNDWLIHTNKDKIEAEITAQIKAKEEIELERYRKLGQNVTSVSKKVKDKWEQDLRREKFGETYLRIESLPESSKQILQQISDNYNAQVASKRRLSHALTMKEEAAEIVKLKALEKEAKGLYQQFHKEEEESKAVYVEKRKKEHVQPREIDVEAESKKFQEFAEIRFISPKDQADRTFDKEYKKQQERSMTSLYEFKQLPKSQQKELLRIINYEVQESLRTQKDKVRKEIEGELKKSGKTLTPDKLELEVEQTIQRNIYKEYYNALYDEKRRRTLIAKLNAKAQTTPKIKSPEELTQQFENEFKQTSPFTWLLTRTNEKVPSVKKGVEAEIQAELGFNFQPERGRFTYSIYRPHLETPGGSQSIHHDPNSATYFPLTRMVDKETGEYFYHSGSEKYARPSQMPAEQQRELIEDRYKEEFDLIKTELRKARAVKRILQKYHTYKDFTDMNLAKELERPIEDIPIHIQRKIITDRRIQEWTKEYETQSETIRKLRTEQQKRKQSLEEQFFDQIEYDKKGKIKVKSTASDKAKEVVEALNKEEQNITEKYLERLRYKHALEKLKALHPTQLDIDEIAEYKTAETERQFKKRINSALSDLKKANPKLQNIEGKTTQESLQIISEEIKNVVKERYDAEQEQRKTIEAITETFKQSPLIASVITEQERAKSNLDILQRQYQKARKEVSYQRSEIKEIEKKLNEIDSTDKNANIKTEALNKRLFEAKRKIHEANALIDTIHRRQEIERGKLTQADERVEEFMKRQTHLFAVEGGEKHIQGVLPSQLSPTEKQFKNVEEITQQFNKYIERKKELEEMKKREDAVVSAVHQLAPEDKFNTFYNLLLEENARYRENVGYLPSEVEKHFEFAGKKVKERREVPGPDIVQFKYDPKKETFEEAVKRWIDVSKVERGTSEFNDFVAMLDSERTKAEREYKQRQELRISALERVQKRQKLLQDMIRIEQLKEKDAQEGIQGELDDIRRDISRSDEFREEQQQIIRELQAKYSHAKNIEEMLKLEQEQLAAKSKKLEERILAFTEKEQFLAAKVTSPDLQVLRSANQKRIDYLEQEHYRIEKIKEQKEAEYREQLLQQGFEDNAELALKINEDVHAKNPWISQQLRKINAEITANEDEIHKTPLYEKYIEEAQRLRGEIQQLKGKLNQEQKRGKGESIQTLAQQIAQKQEELHSLNIKRRFIETNEEFLKPELHPSSTSRSEHLLEQIRAKESQIEVLTNKRKQPDLVQAKLSEEFDKINEQLKTITTAKTKLEQEQIQNRQTKHLKSPETIRRQISSYETQLQEAQTELNRLITTRASKKNIQKAQDKVNNIKTNITRSTTKLKESEKSSVKIEELHKQEEELTQKQKDLQQTLLDFAIITHVGTEGKEHKIHRFQKKTEDSDSILLKELELRRDTSLESYQNIAKIESEISKLKARRDLIKKALLPEALKRFKEVDNNLKKYDLHEYGKVSDSVEDLRRELKTISVQLQGTQGAIPEKIKMGDEYSKFGLYTDLAKARKEHEADIQQKVLEARETQRQAYITEQEKHVNTFLTQTIVEHLEAQKQDELKRIEKFRLESQKGLPSSYTRTPEQLTEDAKRIVEEYEYSQTEKKYLPPTVKKAIEALQHRMKLSRQQLYKLQQEQKKLLAEQSEKKITLPPIDILPHLTDTEREIVTELNKIEKLQFDLKKKEKTGTLSQQEVQQLQELTSRKNELRGKMEERETLLSGILSETLSEKIVRLNRELTQEQEHKARTQVISHDFKIPVKKDSSGQSYIELILEDTERPAKKDESGRLIPQEPDITKTKTIRISLPSDNTEISASDLQKLLRVKDGEIILNAKEGMRETFTVKPEELEFHGKKHAVGTSFSDFINEEQRELQRKYQDENKLKRELAETIAQEYGKPIDIDTITSLHLIDREEQLRQASTPFSAKDIFKTYDEKGKEVKIKVDDLQKQVEEDRATDLYHLQKKLADTFKQRIQEQNKTFEQQLHELFTRQSQSDEFKKLSRKQQIEREQRYTSLQRKLREGTPEAREEVIAHINEQNRELSQTSSQQLPFYQRIIRIKSDNEKDILPNLAVVYSYKEQDNDILTSIAPISLTEERPILPKKIIVPFTSEVHKLQQELHAQQQLLQFLQHPEQQARRYKHRSIPRTPLSFSSEKQVQEYINQYMMPAPRSNLTLKSFIDNEITGKVSQLPEISYSDQGKYIYMLKQTDNRFEYEPLENPQFKKEKEDIDRINERIQYYKDRGYTPVTSEGLPFAPQEEQRMKERISKEASDFLYTKTPSPENFKTEYPGLYNVWSQEVNYMKRADVPKHLYHRVFELTDTAKTQLESLSKKEKAGETLLPEELTTLTRIRSFQPEYVATIKRDEWDRYMNTVLSSTFRAKKPAEDLYETQQTNAEEYRFLDMPESMLYPRITKGIESKHMTNLWKNHVFKNLPAIEYTTEEGTVPNYKRIEVTEGKAQGIFRYEQESERVVKSGRIPVSPFETLGRYIAEDELKIQKIKQAKYINKTLPNMDLPEESDRITLRGLQERALRTAQFKLPFKERLQKMKSFFKRSHDQQIAINAQERGKLKLSQLMREKTKVETARTFSNKMKEERITSGRMWSPMKAVRKYLDVLKQREAQKLKKIRQGKYVRPTTVYVQDTSREDKFKGLKGIQIPLKKQYDEQVTELDNLMTQYPERVGELKLAKQKLQEKYIKRQKEVSNRKERKEFSIDDKLKRAGFSPSYTQPLGNNQPSQAYKDLMYLARYRKAVQQNQELTPEQFLRKDFKKVKSTTPIDITANRERLDKARAFSNIYYGTNLQDIMNAQQQGSRHSYTEGIRSRSFTPVERQLTKSYKQQYQSLKSQKEQQAIENAPLIKQGYKAFLSKEMREKRHKEAVFLSRTRKALQRETDQNKRQQLQDKLQRSEGYRGYLTEYKQKRMKPVLRVRKDYYDVPANKQRIDNQIEGIKQNFIQAKQDIYQRMKDRRIYKQAYIQEKIQERQQQFQQRRRRKRVKVKQGFITRLFKQYKRNKQREQYRKKREEIRKIKLEQRKKYLSRNQYDARERALKYVQGIYQKKMLKKDLTEQEKYHYKARMNRVNTSLKRIEEKKSNQRMNTPTTPSYKRY